ncbi:hypothetical protein ZORO111903_13845 [Zobellia roscoffensis]|uniref:hypothetical protein n=1 Tax=Zobellia roscoffensis TaxID=2779508 RepID=UPI00188C0E6D|nr:hypothetical protein [Zobellia roscoffensis]
MDHQKDAIDKMDLIVLSLGEFIKAPKSKIISYMLNLIARLEEKNVGKVILKLKQEYISLLLLFI